MDTAERSLQIVFIEDVPTEMELVARQLRRSGLLCHLTRVETAEDLRQTLLSSVPDIVMSDFSLPRFDGMSALKLTRELLPEVPFIFVSGTIGEERAIEALRLGATDYVLKSNLGRLAPVVRRALREMESRAAKLRAEQRLHDLVRVHTMLSSMNSAVLRSLGRKELLEEAARIAAEQGGYGLACVFLIDVGKGTLRPFVWRGTQLRTADNPEFGACTYPISGTSAAARAVRALEPVVDQRLQEHMEELQPGAAEGAGRYRAVVALPLIVDKTAIGTLNLYSTESDAVTTDELNLLRQVAGNISFALQYLHKEDKVQFLAFFDPLTGLAQRSLFSERLARMIEGLSGADATAEHPAALCVTVFDIERLSAINDSYGRHTGDRLLQFIADRLKGLTTDSSHLAHFGGGRFAVMFPAPEGADGSGFARTVPNLVGQVFERPFPIEGAQVHASARSGSVCFPRDGVSADVLVQNAELALRTAREEGERHLDYVADLNRGQVQRLTLEHKLRRALDEQQFVLHYQPKIAAEGRRVVGVEALMRWQDPETGLVLPGAFIPVLEECGLITDVGKWAIEQAIADGKRWHELSRIWVPIAVNVSNLQLRRKDFVNHVMRAMSNAGPVAIDVEITESALMEDLAGAMRTLEKLKEAGISIAIDDFGTGYSSLRQLSRLPVDTLKIDRSFISGLSSEPADMTIVSTIIALARAFDLTAVAEGVETEEQLKLLRLLKCHQLQGYLIARPMPPDELGHVLASCGGVF